MLKINDYLLPFLLLLIGITIGIQWQEIQNISLRNTTQINIVSNIKKSPLHHQQKNILIKRNKISGINQKQGNLCIYNINDESITMNASCLINPPDKLLSYNFTGIIEEQRKDIAGFNEIYDDTISKFTYHTAHPLRKTSKKQIISKYRKQKIKEIKNNPYQQKQKYIFSRKERSIIVMNLYSYFPTNRNISEYGPCSARNYYVAAISIDKKIVYPGKIFNINKRIAYRTGYCKSIKDQNPFNGGVCGVATQIFRIALLHPMIEVIERENHQIWYSQYYGEKIWGDDAGIAGFYKNLILKNKDTVPIYFKYLDKDPNKLVNIVAISPTTKYQGLKTTIQKEQLGPLQAKVTSSSVLSGKIFQNKIFYSQYTNIINDTVN